MTVLAWTGVYRAWIMHMLMHVSMSWERTCWLSPAIHAPLGVRPHRIVASTPRTPAFPPSGTHVRVLPAVDSRELAAEPAGRRRWPDNHGAQPPRACFAVWPPGGLAVLRSCGASGVRTAGRPCSARRCPWNNTPRLTDDMQI